jgi:RHS repeat-associated protein
VQYATNLTYDQLNRPVSISWNPAPTQTAPGASSTTFAYGYDATNRRISQSATDKSWWRYPTTAGSLSYAANSLNEYSTVGSVSPTYDSNGDLTFDGTYSYCYDAESRLTGILSGGTCASPATTVASYAYDAQGRRKLKTVGSTGTIYITDADNREVLEYSASSGAPANWYSFAPVAAFGPDAVLNQMDVSAGTRQTLIPDVQGSIAAALASNGALTRFGYETYGENPGLTSGSYRYAARRLDAETAGSPSQPDGLYYNRARMYSPALGRFLQPDPLGYAGGNNLYAYVDDDPLNLLDPYGWVADNPRQGAAASAVTAGGTGGGGGAQGPPETTATNTSSIATSGADFYVTSGGTALPATGYRAVGGPAVAEAEAGTISPRNPTYITFDNITNMSPSAAQSLLQLPRTPTYWVSFDTLPLVNDLTIPTGKWNTTTTLEPITNTFPEWGSGGGTQAITNQPIQVKGFGTLPTGMGK